MFKVSILSSLFFPFARMKKTSMFRTIPVKLSIAHFPNFSTIIPLNAKDTVTRVCAHTDLPVEVTNETYMTYRESVLFSLITQKHIFKTRLNTKSFSVKVCQNLQSTFSFCSLLKPKAETWAFDWLTLIYKSSTVTVCIRY